MSYSCNSAAAALATGHPDILTAEREFAFTDADFQFLARLAYDHAGIALGDSKRNLVYSRLSRRLRALRLSSFREYRQILATDESEVEGFINAISTNLTKFFREAHHFEHLRAHVAISFARAAAGGAGRRRLRVWSAGCSTGEEAYSIAAVLRREIHDIDHHDVRILATDIDSEVIARGACGEYPRNSIEEVPAAYREFFRPSGSVGATAKVVMKELRSLVVFRRLNLMDPWPFSGKFDAIFCRNVMIYFDGPTKSKLVDRLTQQLQPGGWLYIGHSESLLGAHPGLDLAGRTTYRKVA